MRRQRPNESTSPEALENPFKRRGPGAAHAAPLASGPVLGKHACPPAPVIKPKLPVEKPGIRPLKRTCAADLAGPSNPAPSIVDGMQSASFPRLRIEPEERDVPAELEDSSSGDDGMVLDPSPSPNSKSDKTGGRPTESATASAGQDDSAPILPLIETVLARITPDVDEHPPAVGTSNINSHDNVAAVATELKSGHTTEVDPESLQCEKAGLADALVAGGSGAQAALLSPAGRLKASSSAARAVAVDTSEPPRPGQQSATHAACQMPAPPQVDLIQGIALNYSVQLDEAAVRAKQMRLKTYRQRFDSLRAEGQAKPDLTANKELRQADPLQLYLGHPRGVKPGDRFEGRGGYADDEDTGTEIWYTGMGGQQGKRQVKAQPLTKGNLALKNSLDINTPVRVCRAAAVQERNGHMYRMYAYEGLYLVKDMKYVQSKDGPEVYKFRLVAVAGHAVASATVKFNHFCGKGAVMSRRELQPARAARPAAKTTSRKATPADIPKPTIKSGKGGRELKWRWDNTPVEMKELEKMRWAGHGWSGAKAQAGLLCEDISEGNERVRIALVNDTGEPAALPEFTYRKDYTFSPAAVVFMSELFSRRLVQWSGSKATKPAAGKSMPTFTSEHNVLYDQQSGMLERIQFTPCMEDRPRGLRQLPNVATKGIFLPLQVFYTANKGWGVRCEVDLPVGTFVCCYVGRICTNSEANALRGRDEYLFDLNHFELVAQHIAGNPDDVLKDELDLLPRLPPDDFFAWARNIPNSDKFSAKLPSVRDLVRNRGSCITSTMSAHDTNLADGGNMPMAHGHDDESKAPSSRPESAGSGRKSQESQGLPSATRKARSSGDCEWSTDKEGQVSTDAARVLHECRQAYGGQAVFTTYESGREVEATLSDCDVLSIDAMLEGNVARFINHSCEPNLEKQTIMTYEAGSSVYYYVGFFASVAEGIPAMTELHYDYFYSVEIGSTWTCQCGAPSCRGHLR